MRKLALVEPVDYLVIGHVTKDLTPSGPILGGTVSYSALTAKALGLRVGIVTAAEEGHPLADLEGVTVVAHPCDHSTTYENIITPNGRILYCHHQAPSLNISHVPDAWRNAPIVHLGPVAQEVDPGLVRAFPNALVGVTPQGWMRRWDETGRVSYTDWPEASFVLEQAGAAVISLEDVQGDEKRIEDMLSHIRVLVVTEGSCGARLYWNGDLRYFRAPSVEEVDPVGAGDIFATSFFVRLHQTRDPWEAARFATLIASQSVTRRGLKSAPSPDEIKTSLVEVLPK